MDFDNVISLLDAGKVDEVKTAITQFKPQFEKTVSDLTEFEAKLQDAVLTRDKAKNRLKEVSGFFGSNLDELPSDKVRELFMSKSDDASKAEIANLQKLLESTQNEYNQKLSQSEAMFKDKLIEVEIAKLGAGNDVVNDRALKLVIDSLKDGATIDNGEIVYRDANGATIRNATGRPLSIAEKMAQFKADTSNSFLFKATSNGGGGSQNSNGGGGSLKRSEMSHSQKAEYISKHGNDAYLKLPK